MKKIYLLSVLAIFLSAIAQESFAEKGKITIYRENSYVGAGLDYKIFVNDTIVKVRNNSFNTVECATGNYSIALKSSRMPPLLIHVEENQHYYVRCILNYGFWVSTVQLILVDSLSGAQAIRFEKLADYNDKSLWTHPKRKIGMNLDMGIGFQNTTVATTTDNRESTISAGGGVSIGVKYAYEFSKHFEGDVDLDYSFSELQPYLNNAKVTFSRGKLSITPLYLIPVGDGFLAKWKLGAGIDYLISPHLDINTLKLIGGEKTGIDYENTFGFHTKVIYEMFVNKNWSFTYGLCWTNINYKSKYFIPNELNTRNGSSIDFQFGAYYSF